MWWWEWWRKGGKVKKRQKINNQEIMWWKEIIARLEKNEKNWEKWLTEKGQNYWTDLSFILSSWSSSCYFYFMRFLLLNELQWSLQVKKTINWSEKKRRQKETKKNIEQESFVRLELNQRGWSRWSGWWTWWWKDILLLLLILIQMLFYRFNG